MIEELVILKIEKSHSILSVSIMHDTKGVVITNSLHDDEFEDRKRTWIAEADIDRVIKALQDAKVHFKRDNEQ